MCGYSNNKEEESKTTIYSTWKAPQYKAHKNTLSHHVKRLDSGTDNAPCELCGKVKWLDHECILEGRKCLICAECAKTEEEDFQRKQNLDAVRRANEERTVLAASIDIKKDTSENAMPGEVRA